MMEPVAWVELSPELLKIIEDLPPSQSGKSHLTVYRSDAEARIAELRAAIFGSANYHEGLKHEAFVSMGQMLHDCLKMAREKAEAAEARAEAAEALLKDAGPIIKALLEIRSVWTDPHNDDICRAARAIHHKIGVKDE